MNEKSQPQFLDAQNYRRKRLIDAARMLPVVGGATLIFPLPFLFVDQTAETDAGPMALYLFGVWLVLIVGAAVMARRLHNPSGD